MSLSALLEEHAPGRPTVVTVGTFDGVHTGHIKLLQRTVEVSKSAETPSTSVAVVFKKPPRAFLKPGTAVSYLCSLKSRIQMIHDAGIEVVIPVEFDDSIRSISPSEFVGMLKSQLRMTDFVSGPGAVVGKDREGNSDTMRRLGEQHDFTLHTVGPEIYNGEAVSSTLVRTALAGGRIAEVTGMLGRRYTFTGTVVHGDERGQTIGFPTANLESSDLEFPQALPADGIYATWASIEDRPPIMAATSIGVRPTFERDGHRMVESFLLDFDEEIYDKSVTLEFVRRLRSEMAFEQVEELINQMNLDVEKTLEILTEDRSPSAIK